MAYMDTTFDDLKAKVCIKCAIILSTTIVPVTELRQQQTLQMKYAYNLCSTIIIQVNYSQLKGLKVHLNFIAE